MLAVSIRLHPSPPSPRHEGAGADPNGTESRSSCLQNASTPTVDWGVPQWTPGEPPRPPNPSDPVGAQRRSQGGLLNRRPEAERPHENETPFPNYRSGRRHVSPGNRETIASCTRRAASGTSHT